MSTSAPPVPQLTHEQILAEYQQVMPLLQSHAEALRLAIVGWLGAEPGLKVHAVTLRLKDPASLARKLARPDRSYRHLFELTDLVGLRVTTYFEDAVDRVGKLLEGRLPVTYEHSTDKRRRHGATAFGYRSLHYVCRLQGAMALDAQSAFAGSLSPVPDGACFEVQVRSVLEHAWAEIEHDLGYKAKDGVPAAVQRRLHRLAGLLELADQEFVAIRSELEDYARSLPQRIEAEGDAVQLDQVSLGALLDCSEVRTVDQQIANALSKNLGPEVFFPGYLLKMLGAAGVLTVADARVGVAQHAEAIVRMVKPYFAFAFQTWRLSPEQMPHLFRGYSLFFLAHAVVLRSTSLGIDKVERLAHLYRELDYPDDERAAQRVASMLVDAFAQVAGA